MAERALLGAILAALITALARRMNALSESGQWAAFGCGVASAAAGWPWALLLVSYFVAATAITAVGADRKAALTASSLPQVPQRTAMQVLANGAVFSLLALASRGRPESVIGVGAVGALAAASADTWATETGTLWGGTPRSILGGGVVARGMSGGITAVGIAGGVIGACIVALLGAWYASVAAGHAYVIGVAGGGLAGTIADSLLGAAVQGKRWCERCSEWTERRVHPCGYRTVHRRGFRWMTNDAVNLAASVVGAAGAVVLTRALR
jgi:uncharacterized protein (TIGR00297 family)